MHQLTYNVLQIGGRFNAANVLLGDRYFFVRWDLRILIRNENGTEIRKNIA